LGDFQRVRQGQERRGRRRTWDTIRILFCRCSIASLAFCFFNSSEALLNSFTAYRGASKSKTDTVPESSNSSFILRVLSSGFFCSSRSLSLRMVPGGA